ncbi:MAG: hypothetical protein HKM95_01095 [Inquilinus sp.]|nr:hypothetical protein [Inquilinus sp.]
MIQRLPLDPVRAAWLLPPMSVYQAAALFFAVYLLLLARSAWKQGELKQYLASLGVVAALVAVIGAVVWLATG